MRLGFGTPKAPSKINQPTRSIPGPVFSSADAMTLAGPISTGALKAIQLAACRSLRNPNDESGTIKIFDCQTPPAVGGGTTVSLFALTNANLPFNESMGSIRATTTKRKSVAKLALPGGGA
tara:strand:- start:273 stop:635 length:363 start_codon:yes stop_codon:yes gene_type:complete